MDGPLKPPYEFADPEKWPTHDLRIRSQDHSETIRNLSTPDELAEILDKELGHIAYELACRTHEGKQKDDA